jgi:hypothetical protein
MGLVEINWRPEAGELRKFGLAMIVGFGIIGSLVYLKAAHSAGWRDWSVGSLPLVLWIAGGAAGLLGLSGTRAALPVYWVWMGIAYVMGNIISRLFLLFLFYGMITPMGICMRLSGRDKLLLRRGQFRSYWQEVPPVRNKSSYERQF